MNKKNQLNFHDLFSEHAKNLLLFIRRKVTSFEDAEDIAQNAFIRIQRISEQNEIDNPKAYLYQTAVNLAIDMHRKNILQQNYILQGNTVSCSQEPHERCYEEGQHTISPERLLSAQRELATVEEAINAMSSQCQQAFLLHRVKGLSYNEIACVMDVSLSSVEKYILQALKQSRKVLQEKAA